MLFFYFEIPLAKHYVQKFEESAKIAVTVKTYAVPSEHKEKEKESFFIFQKLYLTNYIAVTCMVKQI